MDSSRIPLQKGYEFLMPREKILRAAFYGRVSDEKQEKMYSPKFQREQVLEYIRTNNLTIKDGHFFFDTYTGRDWRHRKELQKLLEAAKHHELDIVVMYRLDRLSRQYTGQIVVRDQLQYYGVRIVTLDPDEHADDDSPVGEIVRAVYGFQAEVTRNKIVDLTQSGLLERVKEGKLLAGRKPLYGYHWNDTEQKAYYVLYEPERIVVARIFTMYKTGVPMRRIAHILTEEGIPTPNGQTLWRAMTIYNILTNPSYTGKAYAYRHKFAFIPGRGTKREARPMEEWIEVKGTPIPAIIDEATFQLVAKQLHYNKMMSARRNPNPKETLARCGRVICGYCGRNMSVQRTGNPPAPFYRCNTVREGYKECPGPSITAKILDAWFWEKAVETIKNPLLLQAQLHSYKTDDPTKDQLKSLSARLVTTATSLQNLLSTIEQTSDPDAQATLAMRVAALTKQKKELEEERDTLQRHFINWQETEEAYLRFVAWCDEVRDELTSESVVSYERKLEAIEKIGLKATVWKPDHTPRATIEPAPPAIMDTIVYSSVCECVQNIILYQWEY